MCVCVCVRARACVCVRQKYTVSHVVLHEPCALIFTVYEERTGHKVKISFVLLLIKIKMRNIITLEWWRRLVEDRRIMLDGSLGKK